MGRAALFAAAVLLTTAGVSEAAPWRSGRVVVASARMVPSLRHGLTVGMVPQVQMRAQVTFMSQVQTVVGPGGRTSMTTTMLPVTTLVPVTTMTTQVRPTTSPSITRFWTYEIDDGETRYVVAPARGKRLRFDLDAAARFRLADEATLLLVGPDGREHKFHVAARKAIARPTGATARTPSSRPPSGRSWGSGSVVDVMPLPGAWVYSIRLGSYVYLATKVGTPCVVTIDSALAAAVEDDRLYLVDETGREQALGVDGRRPVSVNPASPDSGNAPATPKPSS